MANSHQRYKIETKIGKQNHVIVPIDIVKSLEIKAGDTISAQLYRNNDVRRGQFFASVHEHNNSFVIPKKIIEAFKLQYGDSIIIEIVKVFKDTIIIS